MFGVSEVRRITAATPSHGQIPVDLIRRGPAVESIDKPIHRHLSPGSAVNYGCAEDIPNL
jgi:hypothetical protein